MARRTVSGAWRRRSSGSAVPPPLHPALDPEHLTPTPEPEPGPVPWVSTAPAPVLPHEMMGGDPSLPAPGGVGPVWEQVPGTTLPVLPGATLEQAQAARGAAHMTDDGSVAANSWTDAPDRDGTPHLDRIDLSGKGSDSPETVAIRNITGVESPLDPGARRGHRHQRWYDRYIDMHRYAPEYPPKTVRNAATAKTHTGPTEPTQRDTPWPSITGALSFLRPPDEFVEPMMRRSPRDWQEANTTDGTPLVPAQMPEQYGLTTWGA